MRHPSPALEWFTNPDCYVSAILLVIAGCVTFSAIGLMGQQATSSIASFPLDSVAGLEVFNGKAEVASYRGRRGVHLIALPGRSDPEDNESVHAFVAGVDFRDGTIEADVAVRLCPERLRMREASSASTFAARNMVLARKASICGPPMAEPMISCAAITLCNMTRCRIFPGSACEKRAPEFMNPTPISKRARGRT